MALIVGGVLGYSGVAGNAVTTTTTRVSTETVTSRTTLTSTSIGTVTLTQNVSVPCQVGPWSPESNTIILSNGTHVTQVFQPVFLMEPGSTAAVCVTYHNPSSQTIKFNPGIGVVDWGPNSSGGNVATAVTTNSSVSTISLFQGQNATVIFGVYASSNATGFYGIAIGNCGAGLPMAVGYQASQVNLNDFPGLYGIRLCPAGSYLSFQVTGFSGGALAYYTCTLAPLPKLGLQVQYCK